MKGATTHTIEDFWRMIWEVGVVTIVMVTKVKEQEKVCISQLLNDSATFIYIILFRDWTKIYYMSIVWIWADIVCTHMYCLFQTKCKEYWRNHGHITFGDISVTLKIENKKLDCIIRTLVAEKVSKLSSWRHHSFP